MRGMTMALLLTGALGLSGCYDDVGVTLHEPGVYKGPSDPLLAKLKDKPLQQDLEQRFKTGQSDR